MISSETNIITWPYTLRAGHSDNPAEGACAMDAINWLVHGKHGDGPECACPGITGYVIRGNDHLSFRRRQELLPYLHRIAGSRSKDHEAARALIFAQAASEFFFKDAIASVRAGKRTRCREIDRFASVLRRVLDGQEITSFGFKDVGYATAWGILHSKRKNTYPMLVDAYFEVLDRVLNAGPQGEPWSADAVELGDKRFRVAGGLAERV